MKKVLILILGLSLTAASCDLANGVFDLGSGGIRGVVKSEDNGESFSAAGNLALKGNINNVTANSLVFDSSNPDTIYLASSGGVYKTTDAAKTWHYILSGITVVDIGIDPYQSNVLYAAGIVGKNGKIIKSLDGGTSWIDIYTEPSQSNPVLAIAVSTSNSSVVLAGLSTGEIIRSVDAGHTWQATKDFSDRINRIRFGPGVVYALTLHKGVQKSFDQGLTWASISGFLTGSNLSANGQAVSSITAFYDLSLDQRQPGVLYLGTEQGVYRTVNDGISWSALALPVKNASLRTTAVAVNPSNSNNLFAAVASTIFKSVNGGVTWETKLLPPGSGVKSILINPKANNLIYLGMGVTQQ